MWIGPIFWPITDDIRQEARKSGLQLRDQGLALSFTSAHLWSSYKP